MSVLYLNNLCTQSSITFKIKEYAQYGTGSGVLPQIIFNDIVGCPCACKRSASIVLMPDQTMLRTYVQCLYLNSLFFIIVNLNYLD